MKGRRNKKKRRSKDQTENEKKEWKKEAMNEGWRKNYTEGNVKKLIILPKGALKLPNTKVTL